MSYDPPYSRTRRGGGLLLTSGILGRRQDGVVDGGIVAEFRQALINLDGILLEEGLSESEVLRLVVYVTDLSASTELNELFTGHFSDPRPTRTTVEVAALPMGALVEIEATCAPG